MHVVTLLARARGSPPGKRSILDLFAEQAQHA